MLPVFERFDAMWAGLEPIGRDDTTGGYRRYAWTEDELHCREWFRAQARVRGLRMETDGNGNMWAWWGDTARGRAVVMGSHLDSVPDGGAFDGPLGVVSAFSAVDAMRERGIVPRRPVAIVAFADEEGARFGVACAGSRLLTGELGRDRALALTDRSGVTMEEAMRSAGHDPSRVGPDRARLSSIAAFIELHVEQGRVPVVTETGAVVNGLHGCSAAVGTASAILPHGRWRFDLIGRADHAGTTALADRDDPMLRLARLIQAARESAERVGAVATVGRVDVQPNGVNAIPSLVRAWLDVRGPDEALVRRVVSEAEVATGSAAAEESWTPSVVFDEALRDRVEQILVRRFGGGPTLSTAAGHDAGILSNAGVPTAMLFVRNHDGTSHSPHEFVEPMDRHSGVAALADVISDLSTSEDVGSSIDRPLSIR
ncbi:allantoate amidohydrolase [Microbacterium sp. CFH 31415]|nr:allantoate amidohydrolase [Microbacterium sp. CFH 31415]